MKRMYVSVFLIISLFFLLFMNRLVVREMVTKEHTVSKTDDVLDGVECGYEIQSGNVSTAWMYYSVIIKWKPHKNCSIKMQRKVSADGGSTFRVQAMSTVEMVTINTNYVGNGTYVANLLLTFPVNYVVIIMLTYVNNDSMQMRRHARPILKQVPGSPFRVKVNASGVPRGITKYCTAKESGTVEGRWVKCGNVFGSNIYPRLERCGPWETDPNFNFDHIHGFRWLPYTCQLHQYSNDQLKRCLARKGWHSLVFAGDSHMRYRAYHWVTRLYGACHICVKTHIKMVFDKIPRIEWIFDARGTRLPLTFPNITLPHEKYLHPRVRRSKFSTPYPVDAIESNLFFINFGHWVLRESTDLKFMKQKLDAFATSVKYLQRYDKRVVWINTVSLPWRTDHAVFEWRENTSPSRVKQFNDLADRIMKENGIQVVNAFQISNGRIAATHDQTHYAKRLPGNDFGGVVENAISNVIINALCNTEEKGPYGR